PPMPEVADTATEETRLLQREDEGTAATRVIGPMDPITPARPLQPEPARPRDRTPARRKKKRSGARIFLAALAAAALIGLGAILLADQLGGKPQLRTVSGDDAQQVIQDVKRFIDDNTQ